VTYDIYFLITFSISRMIVFLVSTSVTVMDAHQDLLLNTGVVT